MNITSINIQEKKPYATGDELCMRECSIVSEVQSSSSERKKTEAIYTGSGSMCMYVRSATVHHIDTTRLASGIS